MAAKSKENIIEKITYETLGQAIHYREIYEYKKLKIKIDIESDSWVQQCYARASVLDGLKWNIIYTIPKSEMKTETGLIYALPYRNNVAAAEPEFKADVERLKKYIAEIL